MKSLQWRYLVIVGIVVLVLTTILTSRPQNCTNIVIQTVAEPKYAYVTLATTDDATYGVMALTQSMARVETKHPMIVLISTNLSSNSLECLRSLNVTLKVIDKIEPPESVHIGLDAWLEALNKLWVWTLVEYDKLVYLDADIIVLKNIDHFFEYPELTGAYNFGLECEMSSTIKSESNGGLNAGVLVLVPSMKTYEGLLEVMNNGQPWENSDQGIVEFYFEERSRLNLFQPQYASFARCCFAMWWNDHDLHVVHFTHFALPYEELALEPVNRPYYKNWEGVPNCDSRYYRKWKKRFRESLIKHPVCLSILE